MTDSTITQILNNVEQAIATAGGKPWGELDIPAKTAVALSLGDVRSAIARLDDAKKQLEEILRTKTVGDDAEDVAGFKVSTSPNRTFDKAAFAAEHTPAEFPWLYKQEIDLKAVQKAIAPLDLDLYYNEGEPRLNFKAL